MNVCLRFLILFLLLEGVACLAVDVPNFPKLKPQKDTNRSYLCKQITEYLSLNYDPAPTEMHKSILEVVLSKLSPRDQKILAQRWEGLTEKKIWKLKEKETLNLLEYLILSMGSFEKDIERTWNTSKTFVKVNFAASAFSLALTLLGVDPHITGAISGSFFTVGAGAHWIMHLLRSESKKELGDRKYFIEKTFKDTGKPSVFSGEFVDHSSGKHKRFDLIVEKNADGQLESTVLFGEMPESHYLNDPAHKDERQRLEFHHP